MLLPISSSLHVLLASLRLGSSLTVEHLHAIAEKLKAMLNDETFFNSDWDNPLTFSDKGTSQIIKSMREVAGDSFSEVIRYLDKAIDIAATTDKDKGITSLRHYLRRSLRNKAGWWTQASFQKLPFNQARERALKYVLNPFLTAMAAVTKPEEELEPISVRSSMI